MTCDAVDTNRYNGYKWKMVFNTFPSDEGLPLNN